MSAERTPAEVVKDLRDLAETLAQMDKYASGLICHTAADLIEQLTAENERQQLERTQSPTSLPPAAMHFTPVLLAYPRAVRPT